MTTFNRFFGEYSVLLCYDYIAERKSANKFKGALAMKNKRTILSTILALVLAMSFIIASAAERLPLSESDDISDFRK